MLSVAVIFGATACGKTALAAHLFAHSASSIQTEIISADSVQVYRGMRIGSAQPSQELCRVLPHHLIGICDPSEEFSVADFVHRADSLCRDIAARGKLPVVLGGTAFYIKHFMYGMPVTPQADPAVRAQLQERMRRRGAAAMHAELSTFDPNSAARIHVHDEYRILRAHEVYYASGRPLSSFRLSYRYRDGFRFCPIFLDRPREELYRRIDRRVDRMIREGLPEEVAHLVAQGCTAHYPAMKAIGYSEFFELSPTISGANLPNALPLALIIERIKQNSRHYAKRQQTFFQSFPNVHHIDMTDPAHEQQVADILDLFGICVAD